MDCNGNGLQRFGRVRGCAYPLRHCNQSKSNQQGGVDRQGDNQLRPGGWLLVEVAPDLARGVSRVMLREAYTRVASKRDAIGATRVVVGSTG